MSMMIDEYDQFQLFTISSYPIRSQAAVMLCLFFLTTKTTHQGTKFTQ